MPIGASTGQSPSPATKTEKAAPRADQWLFLQDAAELTGLSEKTLRRNIKKGALKARKGKTVNAKIQVLISSDFLGRVNKEAQVEETDEDTNLDGINIEEVSVEEVTYTTDHEDASDFSPKSEKPLMDKELVQSLLNELMGPLLKRVEEQAVVLRDQERTIEDQKTQLRMLPDIQKREEEERQARELAELEKQALLKQVEALQSEQAELKAAADKTAALEKELTLAKRPWWEKMFGAPAQG